RPRTLAAAGPHRGETTIPGRMHMSGTTEDAAIRPFTIEIPEAELEALRARVAATRWPDPELVADFSQGVQQAVMQELARYWATEYDLRRCETRLSALPNFV